MLRRLRRRLLRLIESTPCCKPAAWLDAVKKAVAGAFDTSHITVSRSVKVKAALVARGKFNNEVNVALQDL